MAAAKDLNDIYTAIGELTGNVNAALRDNQRLETTISDGLRRLEATVKDIAQEMREQVQRRETETATRFDRLDAEVENVTRATEDYERWKEIVTGELAQFTKTLNDINVTLGGIMTWQATQKNNARWVIGIASTISTIIGAGITWGVEYFRR